MDPSEERRLVRRLVAMDDSAWREFCQFYAGRLTSFVRMYFACDVLKAEEIVQMTFVRCVRSIRTFNADRGRLMSWLRAVARNEGITCLAGYRQGGQETASSANSPVVSRNVAGLIDRQPLPEEVLARQDVRELVHRCLAALSQRQREVLVMKYLEGLTVAEIADTVGLSQKATESLLTRSRESFRRLLGAGTPAAEMLE